MADKGRYTTILTDAATCFDRLSKYSTGVTIVRCTVLYAVNVMLPSPHVAEVIGPPKDQTIPHCRKHHRKCRPACPAKDNLHRQRQADRPRHRPYRQYCVRRLWRRWIPAKMRCHLQHQVTQLHIAVCRSQHLDPTRHCQVAQS
jgi:hypothetical protein